MTTKTVPGNTVPKKIKPRFRVGDTVSFVMGGWRVPAEITEDRGQLGVGGRRLYRIRISEEPNETRSFELPEDDLAPAEPGFEAQPV